MLHYRSVYVLEVSKSGCDKYLSLYEFKQMSELEILTEVYGVDIHSCKWLQYCTVCTYLLCVLVTAKPASVSH